MSFDDDFDFDAYDDDLPPGTRECPRCEGEGELLCWEGQHIVAIDKCCFCQGRGWARI